MPPIRRFAAANRVAHKRDGMVMMYVVARGRCIFAVAVFDASVAVVVVAVVQLFLFALPSYRSHGNMFKTAQLFKQIHTLNKNQPRT